MAALIRWQVARTRRRCGFCREPIEPGTRYVRAAIPPGGDLGYAGWMSVDSHGEDGYACEAYWLVEPYADHERLLEVAS